MINLNSIQLMSTTILVATSTLLVYGREGRLKTGGIAVLFFYFEVIADEYSLSTFEAVHKLPTLHTLISRFISIFSVGEGSLSLNSLPLHSVMIVD
jgi:hypothetical protein